MQYTTFEILLPCLKIAIVLASLALAGVFICEHGERYGKRRNTRHKANYGPF